MMTRPDSEYIVHSTLADPNPNPNLTLTLTLALNLNLNNINEWENALKTHKTKTKTLRNRLKKKKKKKFDRLRSASTDFIISNHGPILGYSQICVISKLVYLQPLSVPTVNSLDS
jgi:hypothetical protein